MVPDEVIKKWAAVLKDITSTTALIVIVLYLVYTNTGERAQAVYAAKASAEEAVRVARETKDLIEGHTKMTSEETSKLVMLMVQICINTAGRDREAIQQCVNYR